MEDRFLLTDEQNEILKDFKEQFVLELEKLALNLQDINIDDTDYIRFLRARQFRVQDGLKMMIGYIKWRASYRPDLIREDELESIFKGGESYFYEFDKEGNLVNYITARLHLNWGTPERQTLYNKYCVFMMERGISIAKTHVGGRSTMVYDLLDFGIYQNMDYEFLKFLTSIFANYYPETLAHIYILDAPWLFSTCWAIIRLWLDASTASKVQFVSRAQLQQFIDIEKIPTPFGGTSQYVYSYPEVWTPENKV